MLTFVSVTEALNPSVGGLVVRFLVYFQEVLSSILTNTWVPTSQLLVFQVPKCCGVRQGTVNKKKIFIHGVHVWSGGWSHNCGRNRLGKSRMVRTT